MLIAVFAKIAKNNVTPKLPAIGALKTAELSHILRHYG